MSVAVFVVTNITQGVFCGSGSLEEKTNFLFVRHADAAKHLNPFAAEPYRTQK